MERGRSGDWRVFEGGHLEGNHSAHAIADGGDFIPIDFGALLEGFEACEEASPHDLSSSRCFFGKATGVGRMFGGLSFPIHINGEGCVTESGELVGPTAGVVIVAPPLVNDDDSGGWLLSRGSFREGEVTVSGDVTCGILDFDAAGKGCDCRENEERKCFHDRENVIW